jgi:GT2 family glycosyltransferase
MEKALAAGADFVLLLNNDTEVAPDFLDCLVSAANSQPQAGMAAPKIYYHHDPQLIWFAGGRINFWTGHISHLGLRQREAHPINQQPKATDFLTGCAILAKRECLEKTGLFDESYYMYAEDVDWCWRARQAGYVCLYQPEATIWHKVSASAGGAFKIYHKVQSNFLFFRRHAKWYHWPTIVLGVLVGAVVEVFRQLFLIRHVNRRSIAARLLGYSAATQGCDLKNCPLHSSFGDFRPSSIRMIWSPAFGSIATTGPSAFFCRGDIICLSA